MVLKVMNQRQETRVAEPPQLGCLRLLFPGGGSGSGQKAAPRRLRLRGEGKKKFLHTQLILLSD